MNSQVIRESLIVAALLHDIGKFYNWKTKEKHTKNSIFFWRKIYPCLTDELKERLSKTEEIIKNHHAKNVSESIKILQECDTITALERGGEKEGKRRKRVETPLFSPTSSLKEKNYTTFGDSTYLVTKRLSEIIEKIKKKKEKISFEIKKEKKENCEVKEFYCENNFQIFENLCKKIARTKDFNVLVTNLQLVLLDFLKFLPSDVRTDEGVEVPLFDHLKLTAAISAARELQHEKVSLICLDIGNIQNFISKAFDYEEARKYASKRIRGRSFFVTVLSKILSIHILRKLNLPLCNELLSSAGSIIILSKKLNEEQKVELEREIEEFFARELKGELNVTIVFKDIDVSSLFERNKFQEVIKEIGKEFFIKKGKKFHLSLKILAKINDEEKSKYICKVCGTPVKEKGEKCKLCEKMERLGSELPKSDGIEVYTERKEGLLVLNIGNTTYSIQLSPLAELFQATKLPNYYFFFFIKLKDILKEGNEKLLSNTQLIPLFEYSYAPQMDLIDLSKNEKITIIAPISIEEEEDIWNRIKKGEIKIEKGKPLLDKVLVKELGEKEVKKEINFNKLSVIYFDVDNAGKVLYSCPYKCSIVTGENLVTKEIKFEDVTISKFITLSFYIHFFFSVINYVVAKNNNIYVIFSGGDDVKAFGNPYEMFKYYLQFSEEFSYFFDNKITFSGGFLLGSKNVPVIYFIKEIENLEKEAKKEEKGRVAFITKNYLIQNGLSSVMDTTFKEIIHIIKNNNLSKTSLYHIFEIAKSYVENIKKVRKNEKIFISLSRIKYILQRNWEERGGKKWEEFFEKYIEKKILKIGTEYKSMISLFIPVFSISYLIIKEIDNYER